MVSPSLPGRRSLALPLFPRRRHCATLRYRKRRTSRDSPKIPNAPPSEEERILIPKWMKRGPIPRWTDSETGTLTPTHWQANSPAAVAKQRLAKPKALLEAQLCLSGLSTDARWET